MYYSNHNVEEERLVAAVMAVVDGREPVNADLFEQFWK